VKPRSFRIEGRATFTIETSSTIMNCAMQTRISSSVGARRGTGTAPDAVLVAGSATAAGAAGRWPRAASACAAVQAAN